MKPREGTDVAQNTAPVKGKDDDPHDAQRLHVAAREKDFVKPPREENHALCSPGRTYSVNQWKESRAAKRPVRYTPRHEEITAWHKSALGARLTDWSKENLGFYRFQTPNKKKRRKERLVFETFLGDSSKPRTEKTHGRPETQRMKRSSASSTLTLAG